MSDNIFEIAGSGLDVADTRVKSMMHNIVNAESPGFKKANVEIKSFPLWLEQYQQKLGSQQPQATGLFYDKTPGTLVKSTSNTDLAIGGDGFFVIQAAWGEGYTRDGRFKLDKDGKLLTLSNGYPLLGERGPIEAPPGSQIEIDQSGYVKVDRNIIDRIRVVNINDFSKLEAVGGAIFRSPANVDVGAEENESPRILQGYLESSNVNIITETMELIYLERTYGINSKLVQNRDAMLTKALEMGRVTQ